MGYDRTKDVELDKEICDFGNTKVHVTLNQYDGGPKKVGLSRENEKDGNWTFSKLGRLTVKEAESVVEAMAEIIKAAGLTETPGEKIEDSKQDVTEENVEDDMF